MKAIIKNRAGKVKYPARKSEVLKSIKEQIDNSKFDSALHFKAKRTENGNWLIVDTCSFNGLIARYITSSYELLRVVCNVEDEISFADTWEAEWDFIPKENLWSMLRNA